MRVTATIVFLAACGRASVAPPEIDVAPAASQAPSGPADAAVATVAPDAAKPDTRVPIARVAVVDGSFTVAFFEVMPPVAVHVTPLPFETLARDQRMASGTIEPADDYLRRAEAPFTQLGTYRDAQGRRFLALVEARPLGTVTDAEDAPVAWWFAARSPSRPITPALAWRVWKGAAGHRQWNPAVLAVETPAGDVIATRYLGAVSKVEPIAVDPAVPMFLASVLENASGVDDEVTLLVVGYIDHELRVLRSVDAGPRSLMGNAVLGPLGSVTATTANGHHALRIREIIPDVDSPCTPGAASDPGCPAMEHVETWEPTARVFSAGTSSPLMLRQKMPGAPITAAPR